MEHLAYDIRCGDFTSAGAASRDLKQHLKRIGAESDAVRRAMIAAYEAEMNVVIHAEGGGRLEAAVSDGQLDVDVVDHGPGIPDVESAMREGWSTASAEARALGLRRRHGPAQHPAQQRPPAASRPPSARARA